MKVLRLDFHLARKPFSGFSNGGSEFKMETLIPAALTSFKFTKKKSKERED
ncbi:hypothetical protein Bca4012_096010 [Brassica carinata]